MMGKMRKIDSSRTFINSEKHFRLKEPRLPWADHTSVTQYVISDPPTIVYHSRQTLSIRVPSVVWQQQREKAYIKRKIIMHMTNKTLP